MSAGTLATDGLEAVHTLRQDDFEGRIYVTMGASGYWIGHLDILSSGGEFQCRILSGGGADEAAAIRALEDRCRHWIETRCKASIAASIKPAAFASVDFSDE